MLETTICKFIMNHDNKKYLYTEKVSSKGKIYFNIYDGKEFQSYNQDIFYSIFGENDKIAIIKFIRYASEDIVASPDFNKNMLTVCEQLEYVYNGIKKSKNIKNPSLWGSKSTLLLALNNYNKIISQRKTKEKEYNYENDYIRVNRQETV